MFVQTAARFQSQVQVLRGDKKANAKSIMGVLKLGAAPGDTLILRAEGEDAENAVNALAELIERKFDEEE
jgi:phosphotransferase system HPr (HPr) family protein